jgi:cell division protein FtsW
MGRSTGGFKMTEMVHGPLPVEVRDPILPRWWRTVDRWTMASVLFLFIFGLILALAASPPLAERNNLDAFHYVHRQAVFGGLALLAMTITSMMSPDTGAALGHGGVWLCAPGVDLAADLRNRFRQGRDTLVFVWFCLRAAL